MESCKIEDKMDFQEFVQFVLEKKDGMIDIMKGLSSKISCIEFSRQVNDAIDAMIAKTEDELGVKNLSRFTFFNDDGHIFLFRNKSTGKWSARTESSISGNYSDVLEDALVDFTRDLNLVNSLIEKSGERDFEDHVTGVV